jgi:cytochrome c oxidase subunit II
VCTLSDTRVQFHAVESLYVPVAIAVAVLIYGAVFLAILRYRARPGRTPSRKFEAPVAEGLYALAIAAIVVVLVSTTFRHENREDPVTGRPAVVVDVTAAKWNWTFTYPALHRTFQGVNDRPTTLVVPVGERVRFHITSIDVIHSFWVPDVRFKRDAFPRRTSTFDLVFDQDMVSRGVCAEFCGLKHADMAFVVRALPPRQFAAWAGRERVAAGRAGAGRSAA